jgi:8-oxo-dGTP pyrophosphatase MutT (NUDIX family)
MDEQLKEIVSSLTGEQIKEKLRSKRPARVKEPGLKPASVLVPLISRGGGWCLLFTKRSHQVEAHKGEISFPGGMIEEGETALAAVLRETHEELGIAEDRIHILGELDEILTFTGFRIRPFVAKLRWPTPLRPNPGEIESVHILSLSGFLDPSLFKAETWKRNNQDYPVYYYKFPECTVWGATARITKNLIDRLEFGNPPLE